MKDIKKCIFCSSDFVANYKGKVFCSKKCFYDKQSSERLSSNCMTCGNRFYFTPSNKLGKYCSKKCCYSNNEWIEKQSKAKIGIKMSDNAKKKMSISGIGKKQTQEHIYKRFSSLKRYWDDKGRVTKEYFSIRNSNESIKWRKSVIERDGSKVQYKIDDGIKMVYQKFPDGRKRKARYEDGKWINY